MVVRAGSGAPMPTADSARGDALGYPGALKQASQATQNNRAIAYGISGSYVARLLVPLSPLRHGSSIRRWPCGLVAF